jgi:hypothetical protein
MRRTHNYPTAKFIYNNTWKIWGDTLVLKNNTKKIKQSYGNSPYSFSDTIENYCEEYFDWLSEKLSQEGLVLREEVYNKIDELLKKYG